MAAEPTWLEACRAAQAQMRARLSPENTKRFQSCEAARVERRGEQWRVETYVETENRQGRLMRFDFSAIFEHRPDMVPSWQLLCIGACN
jgi:hypothetical protein